MLIGSKVFGNPEAKLEATLKNPNQFRDAVLYESLSSLSDTKIKEFVNSPEAKMMLNEGLISAEVLDRLCAEDGNYMIKTTVCHMAKENGDPLWDELVRVRMQERRVLNDLLEKYGEEAKPVAENASKMFIESCIPEYFRHN